MYEVCEFDKNFQMDLEPRLIEYLKKKKLYKKNGIESPMLEKEFSIDKQDVARIKAYLKGRKSGYDPNHTDFIQPDVNNFVSDELIKRDPRLEKIKEKQNRDKEAREQKDNYNIMSRSYDMYRDDRRFASAMGDDFKSKFNPRIWFDDKRANDVDSDEINPNVAKITDMKRRYRGPKVYKNKPPKIRRNDYMPWGSGENDDLSCPRYSLDEVMGKMDSYRENLVGYHHKNENDNFNVSLTENTEQKRGKEDSYHTTNPYVTGPKGPKKRDVDIENYLCMGHGGPTRGAKSLGYPNPAEHYFQYVSPDVQNPDNVVFERGMPSRMYNKDTTKSRYKGRDILPNFASSS